MYQKIIKSSLVCVGLLISNDSAIFGHDLDQTHDCPVSPIKKPCETPPWPYNEQTKEQALVTLIEANDHPTSPVKPVCPPWPD